MSRKQPTPKPKEAVKPPPPPPPPKVTVAAFQEHEMVEEALHERDPRETTVYQTDHRKTNPGLHRLYVDWAVKHLMLINTQLKALYDCHNLNVLDAATALHRERDKKIATDAAWADADFHCRTVYKALKKKYIGNFETGK